MSRRRRPVEKQEPFPLISWDGVPEEPEAAVAVAEPPVVEAPKPAKKSRKSKKHVPAPAALPKIAPVVPDTRFWLRAVLALGGAAVAATLVAGFLLWKRPALPAQPPQEIAFASPAISNSIEDLEKSLTRNDSADAPAGLAFGYRAGDVLTYNFEFVQNLDVGLSATFMETAQRRGGSNTASQVRDLRLGWRLGGRVDLAVYDSGERLAVGWRFSRMSLDLRGDAADALAAAPGEREESLAKVRAELDREALVVMTRRGVIESVAFPKGTSPWAESLLAAIVLTARVTLPEAPAPNWTAAEADGTGKYAATYTADGGYSGADGRVTRISRKKTSYGEIACQSPAGNGALPAGAAESSLEGGSVILWDPANGRFRTFRIDETLKVEGKDFAQSISSSCAGGMRFAGASRDEALAANGEEMVKKFRSGADVVTPGSADLAAKLASGAEAARLRGLTGGLSIEDAMARFERLAAADQLESAEAKELFDRIAAILKSNESAVAVALEVILQGTAHPALRAALTDALGTAETPKSLAALLEIVKTTTLDPDLRGNALTGLAMADTPPLGAAAAARAVAVFGSDPAAEPALLALGLLARKDGSPETAEALTAAGRTSSDPDWQSTYLEALGNAGAASTLPEIEKFLARSEVQTRARATFALRFIEDDRADRLLSSARTDPAAVVRLAAVNALTFRDTPAAKALLEDAARDGDPQVREAAEQALQAR